MGPSWRATRCVGVGGGGALGPADRVQPEQQAAKPSGPQMVKALDRVAEIAVSELAGST
jgi:hypothetical protein